MSALDEITKEKQRVSEALTRVNAQREKLTGQLSELEAAARVLARYSKGAPARRTASTKATTRAKATAPAQSRRRPRTTPAKRRSRGHLAEPRRSDPCLGKRQDAARNRRWMQRGSRQPCRHRHRPAQAGRPHRRARWEALCDAIDGAHPTLCGLKPEQKGASVSSELGRALIRL